MAILVRSDRSRRVSRRALPILLAALASGCLVLDQLGWIDSGPTFSHKTHVEGEELECMDCHLGYDEKDEVGYPRLKACMMCHEDFDEDVEPEARADAFYEDGKYLVSRVSALDLEVTFSHLQHVTDEEGCISCHEAVVASDDVKPWMAMTMKQCVDCHIETGDPTDCNSCHQDVRADIAPRTHEGAWDRYHGLDVRSSSDRTVDRCEMCHEESTCESCHQSEPPVNHSNYWRRRAHGLTARMDRENCDTCHGPDYCDSCHSTATPRSHTGLWGSSRNTHCYGCHISDAEQSCFMCHAAGVPSHALAPPQPPGHDPSSDCRSCHMILSHVDNGDDCNACHN